MSATRMTLAPSRSWVADLASRKLPGWLPTLVTVVGFCMSNTSLGTSRLVALPKPANPSPLTPPAPFVRRAGCPRLSVVNNGGGEVKEKKRRACDDGRLTFLAPVSGRRWPRRTARLCFLETFWRGSTGTGRGFPGRQASSCLADACCARPLFRSQVFAGIHLSPTSTNPFPCMNRRCHGQYDRRRPDEQFSVLTIRSSSEEPAARF